MSGLLFATLLVVVPSLLGLVRCVIFYFEAICNGKNLVFRVAIHFSAVILVIHEIPEFSL